MKAAYEINGQTASRQAFYAVACDPRRSVAVEACAGAGKTWMLVSRIVRALLDDASVLPHEILAITFTKKAAGEMRQRLQEWLQEFASATPEHLQEELRARGMSADAAQQAGPRLAGLYAALLQCDRPVQIRTFHSWFASLLRSAPVTVMQQLGLPVNHELLEDDAAAIEQVWRPFFACLLEDADARVDFDAVVAVHGRHQTIKGLASVLSKRVEFLLADAQGVVQHSVLTAAEQFPEFVGLDDPSQYLLLDAQVNQTLWNAARALGAASAPTFSAQGVALEAALTGEEFTGLVAALFTKAGGARKFNDKLAGIEAVRLAQAHVQTVLAAHTQQDAWRYQQRMTRLARLLVSTFADLKRERGWVDMNDVELAALTLLGDPQLGGWIAQKLDARIRHLLIDEFQDTNPLQWQALHGWLSSYAGAGGGSTAPSVFIVGDPKQSIYRFRRAEPQVFRAAQAFVRDGLGGDMLSCDHTRRNAAAVIDVVNRVMLAAQAEGQYDGYRPHTTESESEGAAGRLPQIARAAKPSGRRGASEAWRDSLNSPREAVEESLVSLECRQAAAWVAQRLAEGAAPNDILVLARKRDRLSVMQQELRMLHIAAQQPEKADIADAPEVQDVLALLDVLVSPTHDLSLAQALRSPLFSVADDDLVGLARSVQAWAQSHPDTGRPGWWDVLTQADALPPRLVGVGQTLHVWQNLLRQLPPHDALVQIYAQGDVLARFAAAAPKALRASVLAHLNGLLLAALQIDASRYATPYGLVRALRAGGIRAPVSAQAEVVRLLTVHGAKGLEAPWVLILDADAPAPGSTSMGVVVDWPGESAAPERFIFLASESSPPACAVACLEREQAARSREEINALYVALTRAKQQVVLSSIEPHRGSPRSWWQRLEGIVEPIAAPLEWQGAEQHADAAFDLPELPSLTLPRPAPTVIGDDPADAAAIAEEGSAESMLGQAMHRLLEWVPMGATLCPDDHVDAVAQEFALTPRQAQSARDMAHKILRGQGAWAWDAAQVNWQGNEVSLNWKGQSLRLDRLVRRADTDHWWVLDYKSTHQPQGQPKLIDQMQDYRQAVEAAYPQSVVRAAFLTAAGELKEVP